MDDPCDICKKSDSMQPHLEVSLSGVLDAQIFQCEACGFRQVRPRLDRSELGILYPSEYFDSSSNVGFKDYAKQKQRNEREAFFLAKRLRKIKPKGRLLEVGCALGFMLEAIHRYSSWDVTGIDVSSLGIFYAKRRYDLNVTCETLDEANFPDDSFDFIVQKDLLEHVLNPREHLVETCRILKPGGHLWIITPNGEANIRPLQDISRTLDVKENRLPMLEQGHLSFFSKGHLLTLFSECGLECVRLRNINVKRGLRALGYLPRKKKSLKSARAGNYRKNGSPKTKSETCSEADEGETEHRFLELYEKINEEIENEHRPLRGCKPYFYFRHFIKTLDSLPGSFTYGNDFDFLLRKK